MGAPLTIDIVSDVICPWCFVGKRRLDRVIEDESDLSIHWRPYQLDPTLPPEGMDRRIYLKQKFGDAPRSGEILSALNEAGAAAGINFAFDRIERTPNTLDCHRLIRWASTAGCQNDIVEALFVRYFEMGVDIGRHSVLAEVAGSCGMDKELVSELLSSDADKELVMKEAHLASRMGIQGVPCFIIGGRHALMGAQEPEALKRAFQFVRDEQRALGAANDLA